MSPLGLSYIVYAQGFTSHTHPGGPATFTDNEWIEAFYNKYSFWVLRAAEDLLHTDQNAGFAVLLIIFPYFEMIARYRKGKIIRVYFESWILSFSRS
jgi:hypothetical protein